MSTQSRPRTEATTRTPPHDTPSPNRWKALGVLAGSVSLIVIDGTIVNVALPAIRTDLNASVSSLQWVIDIYTLVLASLLVLAVAGVDDGGSRQPLV